MDNKTTSEDTLKEIYKACSFLDDEEEIEAQQSNK